MRGQHDGMAATFRPWRSLWAKLLRVSFSFSLALTEVSCTTTREGEEAATTGPTHYTLRLGDAVNHGKPLPAQTDIYVDWHYPEDSASGAGKTYTGFRGWDFSGSGRFNMVEVLAENGTVQSYVYDFDSDGRTDLILNADGSVGTP